MISPDSLDYENLGTENMFSKLQRTLIYYETITLFGMFRTITPPNILTLQS